MVAFRYKHCCWAWALVTECTKSVVSSARVSCTVSSSATFSFQLFGKQDRLNNEGRGWARAQESMHAQRWPLSGNSPPSPLMRLRSRGTVLRAMLSAPLIVWMLAYRCEASVCMQSSQGKTSCCFHCLLFMVVVSESHMVMVQSPLCRVLLMSRTGKKGKGSSGMGWSLGFSLKFYGKMH